jgi:hypothetical protein
MSQQKTGNVTHDNAVSVAESTRQSAAKATGASQATAKAADIAHYRACLASAIANGIERGQFATALQQLGTGGV